MTSKSPLGGSVLIGFAESLAAIETAWELLDHGFTVHAFSRSGIKPALARDPRVNIHHVLAPELDAHRAVEQVTLLAKQLGKPVLMPLDDASLWILNEVTRSCPDVLVAGPVNKLAEISLDKRLQIGFARQSGLRVPETMFRPRTDDTTRTNTARPGFPPPWVVKPVLAIELVDGKLAKADTEFVSTNNELDEVLGRRTDALIIQQYVRGVGEGLFGQAQNGEVSNWSAHRRIRMMNPRGSGSSACRSADPDSALVESAGQFVRTLGWDGLCMLEFLVDAQGTAWFMELNGRTWGSLVLARHRGLSYPTWTISSTLTHDFKVPSILAGPHVTARHVGRELLHLAFVAQGRRQLRRLHHAKASPDPALASFPSLGKAMRDVFRWSTSDVAYNFQKGHYRVFANDTWQTVRGAVRKGRRR